jgi:DNA-binding beta-propeller fold protein YncE
MWRTIPGLLLFFLACSGAEDGTGLPLQVVADIDLPGDTSRFDYESYDGQRHLMFIAHLGASEVLAFDTEARRVVARVGGISHVHGVLAIPELGIVYASATGTDEVVAIDVGRMKIIARTPGGTYPDGMAYAPKAHKLYVSDESGQSETVIDVLSNKRIATIALGGEVGNSQYDPASNHIFVNVQSRRRLVEIDPATDRIVETDSLPGADGNHGLLIEPERRLAFIACEGNDKLLVFDLDTRHVTRSFEVGESGVGSVFKIDVGGATKIADGTVGPNAHVVAVDPSTHLAYFPIKNLGGRPVLRIERPFLNERSVPHGS